jgi:uncharacterized membrane protein YfcA
MVLQLFLVMAAHFSDAVMRTSGLFGAGIPLVVAWLYAGRRELSFGDSSAGGLAIGAVGAFAGILFAILLRDQTWPLLALGTAASAAAGWLGATVAWIIRGKKRKAAD